MSSQRARWVAVVTTDRGLFKAARAADRGFEFPSIVERRIELTSDRVRVGRSVRRSAAPPEVDLCGPPPDPGVSQQHAELLRQVDGSWALRDTGSTNGTYLAGRRLAGDELVPVAAGAKIRLGMWSRITIIRDR